MIKFEDLKFENVDARMREKLSDFAKEDPHMQAIEFFDNGFGMSIISGWPAKRSEGRPYEIAVIKGTIEDYDIFQEPIGYLTKEEVEKFLNELKEATP